MLQTPDIALRPNVRDLDLALATRFPAVLVFEDPATGPCRDADPLLASAAEAYTDVVRVIRVADLAPATLVKYGVEAVPTLIFRRHGVEVARIVGVPSEAALRAHFEYVAGRATRPPAAAGPWVALKPPSAATFHGTCRVVVTDATFEPVVMRADVPVLVEFEKAWSRSCVDVRPALDTLGRRYAGRVKVVVVDVDEAPESARHYGVTAVPTFLLFREGHPVFRATGVVPGSILEQAIHGALILP